jgi:ATP-binding cassette, subfamily B, bacterial
MSSSNHPKTLFLFLLPFYKARKIYILCFIFFICMLGLHGLLNSYLIKIIIDSLSNLSSNLFLIESIKWPAIFLVLSFELHNLSWRGINFINLKVSPQIKNEVIKKTFNYIHDQSCGFFHDNHCGSIASNINILADNVERITGVISVRILKGLTQIIVALISMSIVHPVFSFILLIWVTGFVSASLVYSKKIRQLSSDLAQSQSQVNERIVDSIGNHLNVKIFARNNHESNYLLKYLNLMLQKLQTKEWFLLKFYLIQGASITCMAGLMIFFLIFLKLHNHISIGDFAFILSLSFYVTENVWDFTEKVDQLNDANGKCNQCLKMLFMPVYINEKKDAKPLTIERGEIVFENVKFHYKGRDLLFHDQSIKILAGQKIGLVGRFGSGKSTFVNLLLRLYDVSSGRILIDGQDIRDVTLKSLRELIGMIPQEPTLFHRTIMDNIRYGKIEARDDEIINSAKKIHADEFILKLPEDYNSLVGERGAKLSGGQRQVIAICRTLLKNASILILDEATSQLDSVAEDVFYTHLKETIQDKTMIVISHRISSLQHLDRILVFEDGKIVADGKHEELIVNSLIYKSLCSTCQYPKRK